MALALFAASAAWGDTPQTITKPGTTAPYAEGVQGVTNGVALHTVCDSGCGGAASFLDLAAFTAGTTAINIAGGVFDDTLTAVVSGKAAAPRMTSKRALHFNLRDNAGNEIPFPAALDADLGFKVHVQNTVTVSGTVTANISGSIGNTSFAATQATASSLNAQVQGAGASGAAKAGNPVQIGGVFNTTQPTVTTGQGVEAQATARGAQIVATGADTFNVTVNTALPAGTAVIGHVIADTGSTTAVTQATASSLNATVVLAAGTALAGKVGIDQTTPGTTNGVVPVGTTAAAAAVALQKMVAVNTTTNIKASAGNVYGLSCANANASICWVQFYNTAGSPTCGTAVIWAVAMPSSGTVTIPPGALALANHATGIAMCMGTSATGATACTNANACTVFYQ